MEQQRDEQMHCADCNASFVFSANEAAIFAERGLTPPKRCKHCRRERKERAAAGGAPLAAGNGRGPEGAPAPWQGRGGAPRQAGPRRYTGDVNEYRSPMGDSFSASPYGMPARGGALQSSGEYRSPMPDGNVRRGAGAEVRAPRAPRQEGNFRPGSGRPGPGRPGPGRPGPGRDGGARPRPAPSSGAAPVAQVAQAHAAPKAARKRPAAELFSITCNACSAQAEVPFKPAEGREVFCPACYRARRPST